MNTTLLFFALLVPVSGFIAWAGDRIGHVIGKRRQSLFGLRPRHTAILITILTGVGISAASFGMMFLSSASFRDVVQRGSQLRRENEQLSQKIQETGERVKQLQSAAVLADQERQRAEQARIEAAKRRTEAEGKFSEATVSLKQAEEALATEKARLGRTQGSLEAAERQVGLARGAVREARQRREKAEAAAKTIEVRLTSAREEAKKAQLLAGRATREFNLVVQEQKRRLTGQRGELAALGVQVVEQTKRLADQQRTLDEQGGQAERQKREVMRLASELETLEEQRKELAARRKEAQESLDEAQASLNEISKTTMALRNGQISYRVGEEVARLGITGGSEWKVHNALEGLLTVASRQAEKRGARMASGAIRAVWIPERRVMDEAGKLQSIAEFEAIHTAAKNISKSKDEVVVVVTALGNAVMGEPVPVDIRTWRNPLILTAGQPLGELVLEGNRPGAEIADSLYRFLRGEVHKKLLEAGTIPFGDADEQSVGETSMATLLKALDAVRAIRTKARVTVRAAKDLRAADPVALEFEVKPVEPPTITISDR
ncbi:MAG: DUF3084 domain-containing protein [Armatimonadetes bacterium]|nr:DUF3084 domain-containing protein [Armatimonadota bacterium]